MKLEVSAIFLQNDINSNESELLFWLSIYSLAFKAKVILLSLISELSEATPVSTTDNEDLERSSSLRLRIHMLDTIT